MIKNKERVKKFGEVFTPIEIVNDMLNINGLKEKIEDTQTTILEPAVGQGAFLVEILKRRFEKILNVENNLSELEDKFILVIKTIYGIELLEDNLIKCRENIYNCFINYYDRSLEKLNITKKDKVELFNNVKSIIELNIVQGNFLTGKNSQDKDIDFLDMKFDVIIGNPPYQKLVDKNNFKRNLASPIFGCFVMKSIEMQPNMVSFIIPSRWFTGDSQNKSFFKLRDFIKNNNRIKELHYFPNSSDIFNNVSIVGGVCYFLWDCKHSGDMIFSTHNKGIKNDVRRPLFYQNIDIIIKDKMEIKVLDKILSSEFISLKSIIKSWNVFGIVGKENVVNQISRNTPFENSVKLRCKGNEIRYIEKKYIVKNIELCINKYKVFISKSAGSPDKDFKVLGNPYIAEPNEACTDSLISIGDFKEIEETENLRKYICTKFLRYIVNIAKSSQNVYSNVYQFVPMQNFTNNSDIDWTKSIDEIDEQLFKKYGLDEEEINYIKGNIKSME